MSACFSSKAAMSVFVSTTALKGGALLQAPARMANGRARHRLRSRIGSPLSIRQQARIVCHMRRTVFIALMIVPVVSGGHVKVSLPWPDVHLNIAHGVLFAQQPAPADPVVGNWRGTLQTAPDAS